MTGLVDSFSYLVLGHVFVANVTGNVVFLAFALAGASGFSITASVAGWAPSGVRIGAVCWRLSPPSRQSWSWLGGGRRERRRSGIRGGPLRPHRAARPGLGRDAGLAVPDLTTTVLTLTITGIFADGRLAGGSASKIGRRLLSVLAMFLGALAGALLVLRTDAALAIAAASIVLVVVALAAALQFRTDRPWIHAPGFQPAGRDGGPRR